MGTAYMVVAKDGNEYGPIDRDTIQQWYHEGRLDQNSKVYEPGQHKFRLKEVFDLTVWNNPSLVAQAAGAANTAPTFEPKSMSQLTGEEDRQPTPGMFAAGVLLIINGVMGLLVIGLTMIGQLTGMGSRGYVVPIIDLIVAAGLIRGNEKYRKWGLVRAVLGGIFFLLAGFVSTLSSNAPSSMMAEIPVPSVTGWLLIVFQLIFCAGIAALLWGDWPSKIRVGIGVAAVLVAWSGIITTSVVSEVVAGFKERSEFTKYTIPTSSFEDDEIEVRAKIPEGWALLTKENPLAPVKDAAMIAVHHNTGCFAALLVEPDILGGTSPDGYLTLVLQNRQKGAGTIKELARRDVDFGGYHGRRLETSWSQSGRNFRGFSTACKTSHSYYMLSGWCLDESFSKAFAAFQTLEGAFELGPQPATSPTEITSESEDEFYDLVFFIEDHKTLADGWQTITARGVHEGTEVGFELSLGSSWREGSMSTEPGIVTYVGTANYRSVGAASDSLIQVMDQLFETKQSPKRMTSETRFSAISLEGDPRNIEAGPVKLKLFFEGAPSRQIELFTNIDLKARRLYVGEKDPDYRKRIIKTLGVS